MLGQEGVSENDWVLVSSKKVGVGFIILLLEHRGKGKLWPQIADYKADIP